MSRALLFPGQGAHDVYMLDTVRETPSFKRWYVHVCELLQRDPLNEIARGNPDVINQNAVSSLLTLLASRLYLDYYLDTGPPEPTHLVGYSVGQWMALHVAGVIPFDTLLEMVYTRATMMDTCFANHPGGMLAVIGIREETLQTLCAELQDAGNYVIISNYNCVGQYSVAGTAAAIDKAYEHLKRHTLKKLIRLPVSGAWHCALLDDAATAFADYLSNVPLAPLQTPVIDNVTGDLLPTNADALKAQLVTHLIAPVRWQTGLKTLIALGCTDFVEVGYGNTLTKFGFFIDRSVKHQTFTPTLQPEGR